MSKNVAISKKLGEARKAICTECAHHLHIIKNPAAPEVWYNHFCAAQPLVLVIDPVTGRGGYTRRNDLGMVFLSEDAFGYCRDLNDGNCPRFQCRNFSEKRGNWLTEMGISTE